MLTPHDVVGAIPARVSDSVLSSGLLSSARMCCEPQPNCITGGLFFRSICSGLTTYRTTGSACGFLTLLMTSTPLMRWSMRWTRAPPRSDLRLIINPQLIQSSSTSLYHGHESTEKWRCDMKENLTKPVSHEVVVGQQSVELALQPHLTSCLRLPLYIDKFYGLHPQLHEHRRGFGHHRSLCGRLCWSSSRNPQRDNRTRAHISWWKPVGYRQGIHH